MDAVEEVKGRLPIEDIVGQYVDLKRSGASYKGLCPFHQEKTPSFYVTPSRGTYHCFGCGKGGDIFSFVMELERLAFPDALSRLAEQAGISLPERDPEKPSLKGRLHEVNEAAARFFAEALRGRVGSTARLYLENRRFGPEAIMDFDLGFAPENRDALTSHLRRAGFDEHLLLAAGLVLQDDTTQQIRDRFRGRLMFPIRDAAGKISGFGGRALADTVQPKYLNSPQTEIFDKSGVLFGVHRARDAIRREGRAVLVEGYLDAVRAHVAGYANVVASLGTAVTTQQLMSLSRLTATVVLALDPDAAGQSAAARTSLDALTALTQARGRQSGSAAALDLRIAELPREGGDPDELIRDHPEKWPDIVTAAIPAFEYFYLQTMRGLDRESDSWRQQAIDRLLPVIGTFAGSVGWQAEWIERLARDTGTEVRALQRALPAGAGRPANNRSRRTGTPTQKQPRAGSAEEPASAAMHRLTVDPGRHVEERLLALLVKLLVLPDDARDLLRDWEFEQPDHKDLKNALLAWADNQNYDYDLFRETLEPQLQARADTLLAMNEPLPDDGKVSVAVAYYLARLRLFRIVTQLRRASEMVNQMGSDDSKDAIASVSRLMAERLETEEDLGRLSELAVRSGAVRLTS